MPECCTDPVNHVRATLQQCQICGGLIVNGEPLERPSRPEAPTEPGPKAGGHPLFGHRPHPEPPIAEPDEPDLPTPRARRKE